MTARTRTARGCVLAAGMVVGLTGFTMPAAATDTSLTAAATALPPRCTADTLRSSLRIGHPSAGHRHATLVVANRGDTTCTLYGYGGLELVGAAGQAIPTDLRRVPNPGPSTVIVTPGSTAGKNLKWGVVPGAGEPTMGPCEPTAQRIDVIPPDGTHRLTVPWHYGPVCQQGRISDSAYYSLA